MINKNIPGYYLVKNVNGCDCYDRCGYDMLFVVRRNCIDYLTGLVDVCKNENGALAKLIAKYNDDDYIIWSGEIVTIEKSSARLPHVADYIRFYCNSIRVNDYGKE